MEILEFAALGGVGGLGYWTLAALTGAPVYRGLGRIAEAVGMIFLGGVAALCGVYLLITAPDIQNPRTLVFAIACGLSWHGVLLATRSFVINGVAGKQSNEIRQLTAELDASSKDNRELVAKKSQELAPKVLDAMKTANVLGDSPRKTEIKQASKEAIAVLGDVMPQAPHAAVNTLETIAVEADRTKQVEIAVDGVHTLQSAVKQQPSDPSVKAAVSQSLETIATETENPTIKTTAKVALEDVKSASIGPTGPTVVPPRAA